MAIALKKSKASQDINGDGKLPPDTQLITAIDVGTTKVCAIVGRRGDAGGLEVLAHSTVPCDGLRKGNVFDVAVTGGAVRAAIQEVEEATGLRVESAFVGITGAHVSFENRRDKLQAVGDSGVITSQDLDRDSSGLSSEGLRPGRKLIHAIKMAYSLDGDTGIRNPLGMHSSEVEVETHVVTGGSAFINKLVQTVEEAGVRVESLVLEPLASGMAVLRRDEKERSAIVVDIGGGTTDVVGFRRGRICYTGVIPVGGFQFTNDIALTFNTTYRAAETAKLKYASTETPIRSANEKVSLPVVGRDIDMVVKRMDISRLTRERALELIRLVGLKVEEAQMEDPTTVPLVLTGGASNLPGLADLMHRKLPMQVRHGVPKGHGALPASLQDPAYATGVGILLWADREYQPTSRDLPSDSNGKSAAGQAGFWSALFRRARTFGPSLLFAGRKGRS